MLQTSPIADFWIHTCQITHQGSPRTAHMGIPSKCGLCLGSSDVTNRDFSFGIRMLSYSRLWNKTKRRAVKFSKTAMLHDPIILMVSVHIMSLSSAHTDELWSQSLGMASNRTQSITDNDLCQCWKPQSCSDYWHCCWQLTTLYTSSLSSPCNARSSKC